jgi:hypothetical protein
MKNTLKKPVKDHRFQIIGLDLILRSEFLSRCKLNNKSGSDVLKGFMREYIENNTNNDAH